MPLKTSTGVSRPMGLFLMCSQTLSPSSLGRTTSRSTRSGITSANLSSASLPSLHTIAMWPASLATNSSIFAIQGSSSTTRILRPDPAINPHCRLLDPAGSSLLLWVSHLHDGLQHLDMALRREPTAGDQVARRRAERAHEPAVVDQGSHRRDG